MEVKKILDKNKMFAKMLQGSAKLSDRELGRILGASQPTITRFRRMLNETGVIRSYQVIPDFDKIGYPLFAILQIGYEAEDQLIGKPEIIFQASTPNFIIALSVHKNFKQFTAFYREIDQIANLKTVVLGLTEGITKFKIGHSQDKKSALDVDLAKLYNKNI